MGRMLLLFTVLCSVLFAKAAVDIERKKAIIRKLGMCKGAESLPMQFYDIVVGHDKNKDTTIGLKVKVLEEVFNLTMIFNFCKCDASGNPDSCEYVLTDYVNTEICDLIGKQDEAWTVFIDHFEKKPLCPIKPGIYILSDLPISTDFMKYLPISDAVWKLKLEGIDMGKPISCVELEMQISTFLGRKRIIKAN